MVLLTALVAEHTLTGIRNLVFRRLKIYTHLGGRTAHFFPDGHTRCHPPIHYPHEFLPGGPRARFFKHRLRDPICCAGG